MSEGLTIKSRPVRCEGEAPDTKDIWRMRVESDSGDGKGPRPGVAKLDLKKPQEICLIDGPCQAIDQDDFEALRKLTEKPAPAGEREKVCPSSFTPSLTITPKADVTGIVSAKGGSSHAAYTGSFHNENGVHPNGALVLEAKPVEEVQLNLEVGFGPTYAQTQPIGLSNPAYFDAPQTYIKFNLGFFCLGAGRRWERLGMPWEMPLVSVPYSISPFTQTVGELGYCSENTALWGGVGVGGDLAWKDDNNVPNGFVDFSHEFGPAGVGAHFQVDPQGEAKDMRINGDASLRVGKSSSAVQGLFYFLGGAQKTEEEWQRWLSFYGVIKVQPQDSYIGGSARFGYNNLDPVRTGLVYNISAIQGSGAFSVLPFKNDLLVFNALFDIQATTDDQAVYNDEKQLIRFMFQASTIFPWTIPLKSNNK